MRRSAWFGGVALAAAMLGTSAGALADAPPAAAAPSATGGVCIPAEARQAITECPRRTKGDVRQARTAPASQFRAATPEKQAAEATTRGPSVTIDARAAAGVQQRQLEEQARQHLSDEIRILNRLVQTTRRDDPRRPEILLRLAETLFEQQNMVNARVRGFDDPIYQACQVQKNRDRCREQRQGQRQAEQELNAVREQSIRTYFTLAQDHPNFRRMDEVLFSLAYALEQMRRQDDARTVYYELIKNHPESRFIPNSYLSFAEFYFNAGEMRQAMTFYNKVLEFPPARNSVYGYALYKSAWAYYNIEDYQASLQKFVQVIEFATGNPDATDASNLARQARRELVMPYSRVGEPDRALNFFRRYAENEEQAFNMLESLAQLYFDSGSWSDAIAVFHKLMSERPNSERLCHWQSQVTNAVISSRPKNDQLLELRRMVDLYDSFAQRQHPTEVINECKSETSTILVWLATAWHREAVGTEDHPGTNDRTTMGQAARLYQLLLQRFPDMEQLEFPTIAPEDHPTAYRIAYFHAELLWKMEDWAACGPAFDQVVELDPEGEFTSDAAYAAVLCYNNLYTQQYQGSERETRADEGQQEQCPEGNRGRACRRRNAERAAQAQANQFARRDFTALEEGMLRAFSRYVCFVDQADEDMATIKYRRARIYYESNHFEEAALLFKDIAENHRESELAVPAANLYMDCLATMGDRREPENPACITEMGRTINPFYQSFCSTDEMRTENEELCPVLRNLQCEVVWKEAENLQRAGQHREAAGKFVDIFRNYRDCGRLEEVLYNAAINFEAANLIGRAIFVRKALIRTFPEHALAKRAVYLIGANYHALAFYEEAASYYEQFARRFPGEDGSSCSEAERTANACPSAHEALMNAVFFRLGLGDEEKAKEDAELFERNYGRSMPLESARVAFSIGSIFQRRDQWDQVIGHYRRFLRDYGRRASPEMIIEANVLMARGWRVRGNEERTELNHLNAAVRAWRNAPQTILGNENESQAERLQKLQKAVDYTAEALFYLAEVKYRAFQAIFFPRFRQRPTLVNVNRWAQGDFAQWVQQKLAALQAAEAEYNKIATLQVEIQNGLSMNSPRWLIAAAARLGQMYRSFVDAFRGAPVPEEIEQDPELFDIYVGALDQQSEPLVRSAIDKFEFCLITATNVRWFNEWSRTCETELNRLNPRQYPLADELRGTPSYSFSPPGFPTPVELGEGGEAESALGGQAAAGAEGGAQAGASSEGGQ